jgi:hypothetical protein
MYISAELSRISVLFYSLSLSLETESSNNLAQVWHAGKKLENVPASWIRSCIILRNPTDISEQYIVSTVKDLHGQRGSKQSNSYTLKMETVNSSDMSVDFYWTTQHYFLEGSTHHIHHSQNFKSMKA